VCVCVCVRVRVRVRVCVYACSCGASRGFSIVIFAEHTRTSHLSARQTAGQ